MKILRAVIFIVLISLSPFTLIAEGVGTFRFIMPVSSTGTASSMSETNVNANINETIALGPLTSQSVNLSVTGSFKEEIVEQPTTTAYSLHYVSPWGIGVGYTSQIIKYKMNLLTTSPTTVNGTIGVVSTDYTLEEGYVSSVQLIELDLGYLDIFYSLDLLGSFSITAGFGLPVLKADATIQASSGTNSIESKVLDGLIQSSMESSTIENPSAYSLYVMAGYELYGFEVIASYRQSTFSSDLKLNRFISAFLDKDKIEWNLQITEYQLGLGYRF